MQAKLITCCHKKQIFNPRTTQMQNNNKNKRKEKKRKLNRLEKVPAPQANNAYKIPRIPPSLSPSPPNRGLNFSKREGKCTATDICTVANFY